MFSKLKEKLKSWAQSLTKKAEETELEAEPVETSSEIQSKEETLEQAVEKQVEAKEEKRKKVLEKLEKIKIETEKELDKKSIIISESKEKVKGKKVKETIESEKQLPELPPLKQKTEEFKEKPKEIVKEESKPKEIQKKGFFGKLKEKFSGKEKQKEDEYTKLKQEAEKIDEAIHLEPSLDKQLRGEPVSGGLKETATIHEEVREDSGFFSKLKSKITKVKISEKDFSEYAEDLQMILVENNVAYEVAEKIIKKLKQEIVGKEFLKKEIEGQIREILKDVVVEVLIEPFDLIDKITDKKEKPYVILFCGINGTGKTTTIAKLASLIKKRGLSCILAGADTFRAASIEQIKKHGEILDIKVIAHDYGSDPASVGFDAVSYAKKNKIDVVLIDTAGRMHTEKNLMKEIEKISKVCSPDLKIFIGESTTGNDSIEQAKAFNFAIGIDGIILTKVDTDEKGGTALSVGYIIKKPILYLGTGQGYDSLEFFNKNKFIEVLGL